MTFTPGLQDFSLWTKGGNKLSRTNIYRFSNLGSKVIYAMICDK